MARVVLVGEHNPLSSNPEHALYPYPVGCAGWRLWQLSELSRHDYMHLARVNVMPHDVPRWRKKLARELAHDIDQQYPEPDCALVLCGARVAEAFDLEPATVERPAELYDADGQAALGAWRFLVIPHPSGRNLLWNNQWVVQSVRAALRRLLVP